jgi:hypothetical protein
MEMSVYRFIVFLHVVSAVAFFAAHGVSMMMLFKVYRERSYDNLCNYLDISSSALRPAMLALHGIELTGIALTIWAGWWRMGWIWASLALFVFIGVIMHKYAGGYLRQVRSAMGMVSQKDIKKGVRPMPMPYERLMDVIATGRPKFVMATAGGAAALITALMVMKPF